MFLGRAARGFDYYGPSQPPSEPRNVRFTRNSQGRRTLAWDAAPHHGLVLEQVLEGRGGSLEDPWLTGYMVERRLYDPDDYQMIFQGGWQVLRAGDDGDTRRSFTDNEDVGDKTYVYRVRAVNAVGASSEHWEEDWLWMREPEL